MILSAFQKNEHLWDALDDIEENNNLMKTIRNIGLVFN